MTITEFIERLKRFSPETEMLFSLDVIEDSKFSILVVCISITGNRLVNTSASCLLTLMPMIRVSLSESS